MAPRLSGHFFLIGFVYFFVLGSLLGILRQLSREEFSILTLKPWSHVKYIELRLLPSDTGYSILEAKVHFILQVNINLAKALNTVP